MHDECPNPREAQETNCNAEGPAAGPKPAAAGQTQVSTARVQSGAEGSASVGAHCTAVGAQGCNTVRNSRFASEDSKQAAEQTDQIGELKSPGYMKSLGELGHAIQDA